MYCLGLSGHLTSLQSEWLLSLPFLFLMIRVSESVGHFCRTSFSLGLFDVFLRFNSDYVSIFFVHAAWRVGSQFPGQGWNLSPLCWKVESYRWITRKVPWCSFFLRSSAVVHVPGVNDIQSSSSTSQNMSQISRQLNQSQVAWTGSRPPFPGQVWSSARVLPQVPRGRRAPELCSLGIPALRTSQRMELELTASTTARLQGAWRQRVL